MGIMLKDRLKLLLGDKMYFRAMYLLLDAADKRCGQHNVADGAETDEEDLMHKKRGP